MILIIRKALIRRDKGDTLSLLVQFLLKPRVPCASLATPSLFSRLSGSVVSARMIVALSVVRQVGRFRPLYRGRFLGSLAKRYVGHSSNACKSLGLGGGQTSCYGYPKDILVACCKVNHASFTNYRLI